MNDKFTPLQAQNQVAKKLADFISGNHQEFFNQEVEEIKTLSLDEIKFRIEGWAEAYFGAEAEALRQKTKLQAASSVFNQKMQKLSETEKKKIREEDVKWSKEHSSPALASPLKKKIKNTQQVKKDLESGMAALFGDKAEEAMKKLGLK